MIAVDGGFLSWVWREQLIVAVAKDGNSKLQTLAFMICHSESKAIYLALFRHMREDFEQLDEVLVMGDQDKGCDAACRELCLQHTHCVRHMTPHMARATKLKITEVVEQLLGRIAKASTQYSARLNELKSMGKSGEKAAKWLDDRRDHFATYALAEANYFNYKDVTSNNAESVMNATKTMRETPIIGLIDGLLQYMAAKKLEHRGLVAEYVQDVDEKTGKPQGLTTTTADKLRMDLAWAGTIKVRITLVSEEMLAGQTERSYKALVQHPKLGWSWQETTKRYSFELKQHEGEWVVECTCGHFNVTGCICVDGLAGCLYLRTLKYANIEKLMAIFNPLSEQWIHEHFLARVAVLQHETAFKLPTMTWERSASVAHVKELLDSSGALPLAPPTGRGKQGRPQKKKQPRREKRAKPRHEKEKATAEKIKRRKEKSRGSELVAAAKAQELQSASVPAPITVQVGDWVDLSTVPLGEHTVVPHVSDVRRRRPRVTKCNSCGSDEHSTVECRLVNTHFLLLRLLTEVGWKARQSLLASLKQKKPRRLAPARLQRTEVPVIPPPPVPQLAGIPTGPDKISDKNCSLCNTRYKAGTEVKCRRCGIKAHFGCAHGGTKSRHWTCTH